jgi:hydroxylaminobenzene mutase
MNAELVRSGVLLSLLGVLSGFAPMLVKNARMGLAAHVGGVMNGLLLIAVGAVWSLVRLQPRNGRLATRLLVWGGYGNWAVTLLAAMTGAREFAPLAGAGYGAEPIVEKATLIAISVAAIASLVGLAIVASGLGRKP